MSLRQLLLVAAGGAIGAVARYATGSFCVSFLGDRFPWGTLIVNVVGCFLMGWLVQTASMSNALTDGTKLMLGTGVLGAFTTFSTFGVQTVNLWSRAPTLAAFNIVANVAVGLVAVLAGSIVANNIARWTANV